MDLRERAEAASATWPDESAAARAFLVECTPERVLALLDVADAAQATHEVKATGKGKWWNEEGMAGAAIADQRLRAAVAHWREVSR